MDTLVPLCARDLWTSIRVLDTSISTVLDKAFKKQANPNGATVQQNGVQNTATIKMN